MTDATVLMMMGPVEMTVFYNNRGPSSHTTRDGTLFVALDEDRADVQGVTACNWSAVADAALDEPTRLLFPLAALACHRKGKLTMTMLFSDRPVDIPID